MCIAICLHTANLCNHKIKRVVYYIVFDCTVHMVGVVCTHAYTYACDVHVHAVCTCMATSI